MKLVIDLEDSWTTEESIAAAKRMVAEAERTLNAK